MKCMGGGIQEVASSVGSDNYVLPPVSHLAALLLHLLPPASPWWNFPHNNSPASQQIALLCLLYLSWTTNKNPNTICLSWAINSCQALSSRETFSTSLVFCSDHWLFDLFTLNLLSISYCERGGRPVTCWNRILCEQITTTDHPPSLLWCTWSSI